jgi:transcription elongation factor Elf1
MTTIFNCPACNHEHDEPAEAAFVLTVVCSDCELGSILADRLADAEAERHAIRPAA